MKKALIHIGTGKTGTTSIQTSLITAQKQGLLGTVVYPEVAKFDHNFIAALYKEFDVLPRGLKSKYAGKSEALNNHKRHYRESLFECLKKAKRVILSGEYLSTFTCEEIEDFNTDLSHLGFAAVCILVYVRRPESYYLSFIQQQIKASREFSNPITFKYPFRRILENWEAIFPGAVRVRPFDKKLLKEGCVVRDFYTLASEFFSDGALAQIDATTPILNVSLSAEGMYLIQRYRERFHDQEDDVFCRDSTRLVDLLLESESHVSQTRPQLKTNIAATILRNHRLDLQFLRNRYGVEFDYEAEVDTAEPLGKNAHSLDDVLETYDEETLEDLYQWCLYRILSRL